MSVYAENARGIKFDHLIGSYYNFHHSSWESVSGFQRLDVIMKWFYRTLVINVNFQQTEHDLQQMWPARRGSRTAQYINKYGRVYVKNKGHINMIIIINKIRYKII